jgi:hypothetical protein
VPATSRHTRPAPWLVGVIALAAVAVVIVTAWLLASGPSATVGEAGIANTGTQTIQGNVNIGGAPPKPEAE